MLQEYQLLYLDNDIPINRSFYCNNGDIKSRGLEVHVLDNSQAKDCTGLTLKMIIKVPSGELFETTVANGLVTVLNAATGIYQILFPNNMGRGRLIAELQLSNSIPEVIVSRKFSIVGDGSLTSDGSISALPQGGLLWNVLTNEAQRQADFDALLGSLDVEVATKYAELEVEYATDLTDVKSQLAETMNKTAITLTHIFADNTARDTYFTANPLEKINLTFIKVGTAYQQLINGAWESANPILVEAVNQIDDANIGTTKTLSASKELALLALKADKAQEVWQTPTLINGWTAINPIQYMKDQFGFVHFRGRFGATGTPETPAFTLIEGYRPPQYVLVIGASGKTTISNVMIGTNGTVAPYVLSGSIDGISFKL